MANLLIGLKVFFFKWGGNFLKQLQIVGNFGFYLYNIFILLTYQSCRQFNSRLTEIFFFEYYSYKQVDILFPFLYIPVQVFLLYNVLPNSCYYKANGIVTVQHSTMLSNLSLF
ncbi:Hypothetical predicted protein [Olea europaea subsp. europaea]|uniref:Uncharacterized protein n=1 Tax=Olea europaea subsp. europaea TaxID=158383 RepID=A0A8S0TUI2_OLEEU|nr:Hypothetical predicted protein [Olea europaea subsp. europaea]